jgi:putative sigma-54 modulation protein
MTVTVTGRHVVVNDAVRQHIGKKLARLHRVLNDSAVSAQCVISRQRQQFVCELTLHARGDNMLVGVGRHQQMAPAATAAVEKVAQQAQRLADRWKTRRRGSRAVKAPATGAPVLPGAPSEASDERAPRVIRSRGYAVKPMTVEDAVLALAEADQTFLVFRNAASETVSVLYRRPDGHYGLIDTGA